jgi:hypothetical protein
MLFSKYVWFLFIPLLVGFFILAERLQVRTYKAMYDQRSSVERIWGGNLAQPMPSVRYKHFGSDVSRLSKGEIHASNIIVGLAVDYRKKGLVYYTGYNADFIGKYTIHNPEKEKVYLSFIFPYPTEQGEGMLRNVKLLVNGEEDLNDTEYQPTLALWTGLLKPEESLEITVQYEGRGLNQFEYGFETGRQINNFAMEITVYGAKNLDYAESTMPPTEPSKELPDGKTLVWKLDRTLTQFNIGVILPDKLNVEQQLAVMTYRAPAFFILFLASLFVIFILNGNAPNFIQIAVISATYFMFYPLFAYLLVYIDLILAFIISFSVIGLLIFNYVRTLYTLKMAFAVAVGYTFYLGLTSVAALLPTYTGLILTIEGVILIGIVMQVLARFKDLELSELIGFQRPQVVPKSPTSQSEAEV